MNYNEEELREVFDSFGIKLKEVRSRKSYKMDDMYTIGRYDPINHNVAYYETEPAFYVELDRNFVYMLVDFYKYRTERNNIISGHYDLQDYYRPSGKEFITYVSSRIKSNDKEAELQKKYPELREIMRDYEVTKALITNDNKKS